MPLESATNISELNAANPSTEDPASQGDDHIRLIKAALLGTFTALTSPTSVTAEKLNALETLAVSDIQSIQGGITYTAADVLSKILTVDGPTSGIDADLLDGQEGDYYLSADNLTGTVPTAALDGSYDINISGSADSSSTATFATSAGNADTVDGLHSASFATRGAQCTHSAGHTYFGVIDPNFNFANIFLPNPWVLAGLTSAPGTNQIGLYGVWLRNQP